MTSPNPSDLEWPEPQFTEEEAVAFAEERQWERLALRERAELQLSQRRLCMPLDVFHEAIEAALDRPVQTLEIGRNWGGLRNELAGDAPPPSLADILDLVPGDKSGCATWCASRSVILVAAQAG